MPAVARGWSSGPATCRMSWSGVGSDGRISTGTGFGCCTPGARTGGPFAAGRPTFSRGLVISLPRSLSIVAARPITPLLVVVSRSEWIFSVMLVWYPGRFSANCANWLPITAPTPRITAKASTTTAMTASTRLTCQLRSSSTAGPSAKLRSTARAIGTKTSRPK
jgi:hypothetical protein